MMLATIQTDDNWTTDHWISAKDSDGKESWINPTRSDPSKLVNQDDFGYATIRWHGIKYEVQSIDLDYTKERE